MKFKKGQQLVCTAKRWIPPTHSLAGVIQTGIHCPAFNEVVTCDGYEDEICIYLKEYNLTAPNGLRFSYNERLFQPLIEDAQLEKELASISALQPA